MHPFRTLITNIGVGFSVFLLVVIVTGIALVQKVGNYQETGNSVELTVSKKEYKLVSFTSGTVTSVNVEVGQRVKKGDLILETTNSIRNRQISVLESFGRDNVSAQTQLALLKSQKEQERVVSPTDGVIVEVASEGEVIFDQQRIGLIYADARIELISNLSVEDYTLVKKAATSIPVEHTRLKRSYTVAFDGVRQEQKVDDSNQDRLRVSFILSDPADGANMLQGEKLVLNLNDLQDAGDRPLNKLFNAYRNLFN